MLKPLINLAQRNETSRKLNEKERYSSPEEGTTRDNEFVSLKYPIVKEPSAQHATSQTIWENRDRN